MDAPCRQADADSVTIRVNACPPAKKANAKRRGASATLRRCSSRCASVALLFVRHALLRLRPAPFVLVGRISKRWAIIDDASSAIECELLSHFYTEEIFERQLRWECRVMRREEIQRAGYLDLRMYPPRRRIAHYLEQCPPDASAQYRPGPDLERRAANRVRVRRLLSRWTVRRM